MKNVNMDWTIILLLSSFGIVMGALSIKGFTQKIEPFLWIFFGIISALVISKNINEKAFLHAFLIGLLWGTFNGIFQSLFFETYITNNPAIRSNFEKITFMGPRYFPLLTGPFIGLISGLVLGGLTLLARKLW